MEFARDKKVSKTVDIGLRGVSLSTDTLGTVLPTLVSVLPWADICMRSYK